MSKHNGHTSRHSNGHSLVGSVKASEVLGKSPRTIRRWAASGLLKAHKTKGDWAIDLDYLAIVAHLAGEVATSGVAPAADVQASINPFPAAPVASAALLHNDAAIAMVVEHLKKGFA